MGPIDSREHIVTRWGGALRSMHSTVGFILAIRFNVTLHPKPVEPRPSQRYTAVRTQVAYFFVYPLIHQ